MPYQKSVPLQISLSALPFVQFIGSVGRACTAILARMRTLCPKFRALNKRLEVSCKLVKEAFPEPCIAGGSVQFAEVVDFCLHTSPS
jgi:hypothetical protein